MLTQLPEAAGPVEDTRSFRPRVHITLSGQLVIGYIGSSYPEPSYDEGQGGVQGKRHQALPLFHIYLKSLYLSRSIYDNGRSGFSSAIDITWLDNLYTGLRISICGEKLASFRVRINIGQVRLIKSDFFLVCSLFE